MNGFINLFKEKGWTSHDVVAKMRGLLQTRKIGHAGTLDPDAKGVLVLAVGASTKLLRYIENMDKSYRVTMIFGQSTDTQDTTGNLVSTCQVTPETFVGLDEALAAMTGEIEQVPPMYSAVKIKGQKMYTLARRGIEVERKPRKIFIRNITEVVGPTLEQGSYRLSFQITCTKGTYIRTFCHDLATALGSCGVMSDLVRTRVGAFVLEGALRLEDIEKHLQEDDVSFLKNPIDHVSIPTLTIRDAISKAHIAHGRSIQVSLDHLKGVLPQEDLLLIDESKRLLALARATEDKSIIRMKKVFNHEDSPK